MNALLLAAGRGSRLEPITNDIPKCLVPINGKELLGIWIENLLASDVSSILVNTHYLHKKVERYLAGQDYGANVVSIYEPELLGTGGTLLKNRHFFRNEPVILIHADNLSRFNMSDFIQAHLNRPAGTEMTMMTFKTDVPELCGIVTVDEQGVVQTFHEKEENPPGNVANGAVYILEQSVIDFMASLGKDEIDFSTEVIPHFLGKINTFHNDDYHRDIGNVESYLLAQEEYLQH